MTEFLSPKIWKIFSPIFIIVVVCLFACLFVVFSLGCHNLDMFFKAFHPKVQRLILSIKSRLVSDNNNNNKNTGDNGVVVSQFFVSKGNKNKELMNDFTKAENELSFETFLKKYGCGRKVLPKISSLRIRFDKYTTKSNIINKMMNHDKLMKLFNLSTSVKCFELSLSHLDDIDYEAIHSFFNQIFEILNHLQSFECSFCPTKQETMDKCFKILFIDILQTSVFVSSMKKVTLQIGSCPDASKWDSTIDQTIKIENQTSDSLLKKEILRQIEQSTKLVYQQIISRFDHHQSDIAKHLYSFKVCYHIDRPNDLI